MTAPDIALRASDKFRRSAIGTAMIRETTRRTAAQARVLKRLALLSFALSVAVGCSSARVRSADQGGPQWLELVSPHFELRTNLQSSEARTAIQHLERTRSAFISAFWSSFQSPPGRMHVYLVDDDPEFGHGGHSAGWGIRQGVEISVVLMGSLRDLIRWTIIKEAVAEALNHYFLLRLPYWLDTGLALYLGNADVEPNRTEVFLGYANELMLRWNRYERVVYPADLVDWPGSKERGGSAKGTDIGRTSFLMVHYLVDFKRNAF